MAEHSTSATQPRPAGRRRPPDRRAAGRVPAEGGGIDRAAPPGETAPPGDTGHQDQAPQDQAPQDPANQDQAPQNPAYQDTRHQDAASADALPELSPVAERALRLIGGAQLAPGFAAGDSELLADLLTAAREAGYLGIGAAAAGLARRGGSSDRIPAGGGSGARRPWPLAGGAPL